ncbi:protein AF-9-like protein [Dinothrombium tinctorium]|uniref:Protein AF-9-like protein n=1 Tax=Dinothrombium tinctorium TaxID=1965070 RepID=A0A3S3S698_9ACAR|nr:protein AF-9-like protein [Dinothrombium tinctorium]
MLEKPSANPALQSQFTDLFGTPIQPKPSPESTAYRSKEAYSRPVNSSISISSKKSQKEKTSDYKRSSSHEKERKHKSSKSTKSEKIASESSSSRKEISKSKLSKSESSKSSETKSVKQSTPVENVSKDKKASSSESSSKSSKKRRRSSSSTSSSFTTNSIGDTKREKEHSTKPVKDQEHKSKKHKSTTKDITTTNNASGNSSSHKSKDVKKESSTSTTISISNNNNTGTTTLEIKSVKKEKTWDSEVKKSKNKEHKNDEIKSKESVSKESSKTKSKEDIKSPKMLNNKFLKVPKEKLHTPVSQREVSSSPASILSGSLTPGGATYLGAPSSVSSVNGPITSMINEMEQESLSPLSSGDPISPINFVHSSEDSSDNEQNHSSLHRNREASKARESLQQNEINERRNAQRTGERDMQLTTDMQPMFDPAYINELVMLQKRLNDLTDRDILQRVVDTVEESGLYHITSTRFDFDLMKLDRSTVSKLKMCLMT